MERPRSFSQLVSSLSERVTQPLLIAIDGPAGSGKTTFADSLFSHLSNSAVIHMDEIYNGWEDALTPSLADNLFNWVINPFNKKSTIEYPVFDWYKYSYQSKKLISPNTSIILEGVGAGNDEIFPHLDFLIWVEADAMVGLARVKKRDGEVVAERMNSWREAEALWFARNQTKSNSQLLVNGNPPILLDITKEFWPL